MKYNIEFRNATSRLLNQGSNSIFRTNLNKSLREIKLLRMTRERKF